MLILTFAKKNFTVASTDRFRVLKLPDFLSYFPWQMFPYIEYLKIDVQGIDFELLQGTEEYIDRFLFVTVEVDTDGYHGTTNNRLEIRRLMFRNGFREIPGRGLRLLLRKELQP